MNTARSGSTRENKLRHYLERQGWSCIRAAGSKGVFDLVAIKTTPCWCAHFFQVKTGHWPSGGELKELIRFAKSASGKGSAGRIIVVRFKKQSSIVLWVDLEDLIVLPKPYDWLSLAHKVDLRK